MTKITSNNQNTFLNLINNIVMAYNLKENWKSATSIIILIVSVVTSVFVLDDRWNNDKVLTKVETAKNDILSEMRNEIAINRTAMIAFLQRAADDLEYDIRTMERDNKPVPRHLEDRLNNYNRSIKDLEDAENKPSN